MCPSRVIRWNYNMDLMEFSAHEPFATVHTRHLFTMRLDVLPVVKAGQTPNGVRRLGFVTGGEVVGPHLRGQVLGGANDWQILRPDGSLLLDVRLAIETDSGAIVTMSYRGLRHGPPEVIAHLEAGGEVDPASYYFRIAPLFETSDDALAWLNGVVGIGIGHRSVAGPIYVVHQLL
jgi:Protein of unknown function (DUF3237)